MRCRETTLSLLLIFTAFCPHFIKIIASQYQTEIGDWNPVMRPVQFCDTDQIIPACQRFASILTLKYTYNDNVRVYLHVP